MADLSERIAAELENIDGIIGRIPPASTLTALSELELAGVAALVHSYYNAAENIIKQVLRSKEIPLPSGESWHKDLIQLAERSDVLSATTSESIREYLAFRHFFAHAYAFDIDPDRITPLVENLPEVDASFRHDIADLS